MKNILTIIFMALSFSAFSQATNPNTSSSANKTLLKLSYNGWDRYLAAGAATSLPFSDGSQLSFRVIALSDLPTITVAKGGTGITTLGSPTQYLRVNAGATGMEWFTPAIPLPITGGTLTGHLLFSADNTYDIGASGVTRPRTGYFGTSVVAPTVASGGNSPMHFQTNGTRRFSIPSSGIANTPSSTKALVLSPDDSLGYTTLQSGDWTNTVTQSGSDTLLNAAAGYGHFQRIGNVVSFTLRVEIALTSAGDANTVYIDPPIASNFTTAASDVIGTATMDPQTLSGANTQRQRCLVFASDSDDKIGVSFDPVASLSYPENRMYISVSGSYVIQ